MFITPHKALNLTLVRVLLRRVRLDLDGVSLAPLLLPRCVPRPHDELGPVPRLEDLHPQLPRLGLLLRLLPPQRHLQHTHSLCEHSKQLLQ